MTDRLEPSKNCVFYKGDVFCVCMDTSLCNSTEAAEMIAALFNQWLDEKDEIDRRMGGS